MPRKTEAEAIAELRREVRELRDLVKRSPDRLYLLDKIVPWEVREHFRGASYENLQALRKLLDYWVDITRGGGDALKASRTAGTRRRRGTVKVTGGQMRTRRRRIAK